MNTVAYSRKLGKIADATIQAIEETADQAKVDRTDLLYVVRDKLNSKELRLSQKKIDVILPKRG